MTRQLARSCPRCGGFMIVKVIEAEHHTVHQVVNGRCVRCQDRLTWLVIRGNRRSRRRIRQTVQTTHQAGM
jgi:hypothetical protein